MITDTVINWYAAEGVIIFYVHFWGRTIEKINCSSLYINISPESICNNEKSFPYSATIMYADIHRYTAYGWYQWSISGFDNLINTTIEVSIPLWNKQNSQENHNQPSSYMKSVAYRTQFYASLEAWQNQRTTVATCLLCLFWFHQKT
jgi:hypothetical protein